MPNLVNDFEVRKETLRALGGNPDGLANIYEVDLEILKLIGSGGGEGIPDAPIDGVQYARQDGEWTPVESGIDWDTIKQKLAEDGVESIKFTMAGEEVILTAEEVKNLLNQTVLPDAPSDGKQYARQDGAWTQVESVEPGIPDAPSDGKQYARQDGSWTVVTEGILDAPIDGVQYARQNGEWTPVDSGIDWNTIKQKLAEDGVDSIKFNKQVAINSKKYIGFDDGALPFSTGHTITTNTRVQMKFRCLKGTDNAFIGMNLNYSSGNMNVWRFVSLGSGTNAFQQICDGNVEHRCTLLNINPDNWYELELGNCYIKDVQTGEILAQNTDTESGPWGELVLNACRGEKGDIAYVKVFEGDELVRDYIAAEDEDGNIGFYESLTNTFTIADGWQRSENGDWTATYFVQGEVILTGEEVKNLLNQTVLPDAPTDGKQYARQNGNWTPVEEGITDAPSDGKQYARQDGAWTQVESVEPGIPDAPSDGTQYARQNGNWTPVEEGIPDAPSDGQQYARQDGAWVPVQTPTEGKYLTMTVDESNSGETIIHPNIEGSLPNLNLQYRINNEKWTDFIVGTTDDIKIGAGDVLQFKGDNKEGVSKNGIYGCNTLNFAISGNPVALSGNIMSLIDGVGDALEIPNDYCFCRLFRNSAIKTVSSDFLPATTLKSNCYRDLFSGCTSLTKAPELPATTIMYGCYNGMFYNCSLLTTAPELPAKVLVDGCYGYMFTYCNLLNYVKCLATEGTINGDGTVPSALDNWLQGVASTGTFEKLSGVSYEAGGNGIPEGWPVKEIYDYVEAPMDGQQYARQNGEWTPVEEGLTDAPSDSKTYGRNNGAWTVVESGYPIKQGVQIDNNVVSVENYGIYTKLNGNFISYESEDNSNYVRIYDKLEVLKDGEKSEAKFIDVANAGNGVVKTSNGGKVKFWSGTQAEYDAIATKDANTLYIIK